jgi:hypothetical protein
VPDVVHVDEEQGWTQLVERWRRLRLSALIVAPGSSPETAFDGHAAILLARLIGAIPIASSPTVLPGTTALDGTVRTDGSRSGLMRALNEIADPQRRQTIWSQLHTHCRAAYAPAGAARAAERLLAEVPPSSVLIAEERWRRLERLRTRTIVAQHEAIDAWRVRCEGLQQALDQQSERTVHAEREAAERLRQIDRLTESVQVLSSPRRLAGALIRRTIGTLRSRWHR